VRVGIADVGRQRAAPVLGDDALEARFDGGKRLFPGRFLQLAVSPHQRYPQPVGVVVELSDLRAFGADKAAAENVLFVAADADDAISFDVDRKAAGCLA
jgi:hypothetical protein